MDASFVVVSLSLFSGFFSLGGAVLLFVQHRTVILRVVVLFLTSLIVIACGFWMDSLADYLGLAGNAALQIATTILSLGGLVLNIAVIPYLVAALVARSIGRRLSMVLWVWDAILLGSGLAFPFLRNPDPLFTVMNVQLVVTIFVALAVVLRSLREISRADMRKSLSAFLVISGIFLVLLVLDILTSRLGIAAFAFLDNSSLPLYILSLNLGSFFYVGRFLNAEPLLHDGRVTAACRQNYGLTARETEIIERLLEGKTNQELADDLFISRKTVENHLYNIYQKMDVKNRVQLIGTLRNWNRVEWE